MNGSVVYAGKGNLMSCSMGKNQTLMDGDSESALSPVQSVLLSHGACSLIDVVDGLRRYQIENAKVELESKRSQDHPRVFTQVNLNFSIESDAPESLIRRLIESSFEKYCTVGAIIERSGCEVTWNLERKLTK